MRSAVVVYGVILIATGVAWAARWLLDPLLGEHLPFVTFFIAVAVATWVGGLRAGLLATALGFLLALYFFVPPRFSLFVTPGPHLVGLAMYIVVSLAIAGFGEAMRVAQRKFAEQGERLETTLASIGDAVITTDTQALITNMNATAETLTGWKNTDAAGRPLDTVFRIVREDTRQIVDNPAIRALREGRIVPLANDTLLIAKNGTERPIDDSAAPIRTAQGQIIGSVIVFRDLTQRRQNERKVRETAHLLATVLGSVTDPFYAVDRNWRFTLVNDEMVKRLGKSREKIIGQEIWELFPATVGTEAYAQQRRAMSERVAVEYEVFYEPSQRWFIDRVYPVSDGGLFVYSRDVTDHKRAEEALNLSEKHLELLSDTVPALISYVGLDGRYRTCNQAYTKWFGLPRERIVGRHMREVLGENAWKVVGPYAERAFAGEAVEYEAEAPYRHGGRRWIHAVYTPHRTDKGAVAGIVVLVTDITERKQGEQARGRLAAIVDSSDDAIISKDLEGVVTSWNHGAERLFGYSAEEAIGKPITILIPDDRIDEERGILDRIRRSEPIKHYETVRRHKDGTLLDISLTISPVINEAGTVVGASKIARDITVRKRAEEALRDADRRKDEFLATLAHELRNPLAPIQNALSLLNIADGDQAAFRRATEMMGRQLAQLVRLVDDLLDVSRISQGKLQLRTERVELATIIQEAIDSWRPLAERAKLNVNLALPPRPLYLNGDPIRLSQVLTNLLNNSSKFGKQGGRVDVIAERQDGDVVVSVRDNGVGIPPDKLESIFDMFSQADQSLERSHSGLGVGLTLAKRLVELHGGSIKARSDGVGKGSEFIMRLPLLTEKLEADVAEAPVKTNATTGRHRILVVDDNRDSADSLAMLLRFSGHEVYTAHDGQEALSMADQQRPNVILLDIGLPKVNGYEVCRRIREQPWGRHVVIVALSGWGQDEDKRRSRDAGFNGHLVKPVDDAALMKLLARSSQDREGQLSPWQHSD